MEAINIIEGPVTHLDRSDVDTDQIIPKQFLKRVERTGFGEFLFYDWLRDGEIDLEPNPILVSGHNFGSGSSREHAVWALDQFGFEAVVAPSFSDIFFSNCTKNGFLAVALDKKDCEALAAVGHGRIDLEAQTVSWEGGEASFEIDREIKRRLLGGLDDIALTLGAEDEIEAFESGPGGGYGPVTTALK
jgi:3-isopropylmalate/(R)-2-methylmalate dehydratase small subunit